MAEVRSTPFDANRVLENILDGVVTIDEQGVIQSMNPAAEKMFGRINNETVGHKFSKLAPKLYSDEERPVSCSWERLTKQAGSTVLGVGRTRRHVLFPIEISLSEMIVGQQKFYVSTVRDITDRKRSKQTIADNETLAATLRSIEEGVITTDAEGKIIMINNAGENLTGWTSREAIGQPLKSVFNIEIDLAAQARAQKSGYRNEVQSILLSTPENATLRARDGTEHVIEQVASPIRDSKSEVAGVVLLFRDITERQRNEAERRKAETLEQLGLLAGGIAHDFNNLLTAIIGNISLVSLLLPPDDEMATRLNDAKNASLRARDLAQQLLTFARGGAPIKKTASIGKLIQDTVGFSLRGTHSRSEFLFGADLWPAEIDPGQISQVVANLVVNADQAMPNGGTLRVSCDNFSYHADDMPAVPDLLPGDYIRIGIKDEGVGMPEATLKRIFDPYFTTKPKGNGLGLATTYSIIKSHNGLICVESQVHFGSTFTLYLPASPPQKLHIDTCGPVIPAAIRFVNTQLDILVLDDEEAIRAMMAYFITRWYPQLKFALAENALEAFAQLKRAKPKLLFTDITLPGGMPGTELVDKIRQLEEFNDMKIVIQSGYASDYRALKQVEQGLADEFLAKPYEFQDIHRILVEAGIVNGPLPKFAAWDPYAH
jgi:two-component system cell cycle sensor histidine kinase/response regulator CckA